MFASSAPRPGHRDEPRVVRLALIGVAGVFLVLFLFMPLVAVFVKAFEKGAAAYVAAVADPMALAAIRLSFTIAAIVVPINLVFGISAAWAMAKFEFPGRGVLVTVIDAPFAVSPVVSGMVFVLLFGAHGVVGPWLIAHGVKVVFALPGLVLATLFVTSPFVARELLPLMESQGNDEEEAALTLGGSGWQTFFLVSLPKIRWGVLYGVVLCNARAMGEFGAVSVVSGHIRGLTNTIPLHVEILYNEYQFSAAFAVASLLSLLAVATLVIKAVLERRVRTRTHGW
jgi:sulfate transport system permease protein